MKVISKTITKHSLDTVKSYKLDNGYEANVWSRGFSTVYTPKGNYASQITSIKVIAAINEYEMSQEVA